MFNQNKTIIMVEADPTGLDQQSQERKDTLAMIDRVLDKIEDFYYEDGENNGQRIFAEFAAQHHEAFDDECSAEDGENKPE